MTSKWFEVTVKAYKTVVVEVPDDWEPGRDREDLANEYAIGEAFSFCPNVEVDRRQTRELKTESDLEQSRRLSDEVFSV